MCDVMKSNILFNLSKKTNEKMFHVETCHVQFNTINFVIIINIYVNNLYFYYFYFAL